MGEIYGQLRTLFEDKNAYMGKIMGQKMAKNDQKIDEKCIYRTKMDHFLAKKRIYSRNYGHFLHFSRPPPS